MELMIGALKEAGAWPGADRRTLVVLAGQLMADERYQEGFDYFAARSDAEPGNPLPLALAGAFESRLAGHAERGIAKLDAAAERDLGLAQFFRGTSLASLPGCGGRADTVVADLEFVLAVRDQFPSNMMRAVYQGLAAAYAAAGKPDQAAQAAADSGLSTAPAHTRLQFGGGWMNLADGFHMSSPSIVEIAPGVRVAQGYDFGDFAFVSTSDGTVAIDAGTAPDRVRAALADAGLQAADVRQVMLTHAHFDHAGGISALADADTAVIAQAGFPAELQHQHAVSFPFRYFTGNGAGFGNGDLGAKPEDIIPQRLVSDVTPLSIGGTDFVLYPTTGGETRDALMVYLPASGVLFAGDVMMPYVGAPFFAEGSPDGLLETLALIAEIGPRILVHGHTLLTEQFTARAVPGLLAALTELRDAALRGIRRGQTLTELLDANVLPGSLRDNPASVVPYLVVREHFVQRILHDQRGYWQPDGQGLEPVSTASRAAALDLLAGGRPGPFADAARALLAQRDAALALEIATAGLTRYPGDGDLAVLRQQALYRLMERHQLEDPFRFLIYAELAGVELGPVATS